MLPNESFSGFFAALSLDDLKADFHGHEDDNEDIVSPTASPVTTRRTTFKRITCFDRTQRKLSISWSIQLVNSFATTTDLELEAQQG